MLDEDTLGDLDLSSLNGLLTSFLVDDDDESEEAAPQLPLINTGLLAHMGTLQVANSVRTVSMNGLAAGKRYNIVADKADVFYYLLSYLFNAISDPAVLDSLLGLFSDDDEEEEEVQNIQPQAFSAFAAKGFDILAAEDEDEDDESAILDIILQNLGIDFSAWDQYDENYDWGFEDGDREGFMNALYTLLAPLTPVLTTLLADNNLIVGRTTTRS